MCRVMLSDKKSSGNSQGMLALSPTFFRCKRCELLVRRTRFPYVIPKCRKSERAELIDAKASDSSHAE